MPRLALNKSALSKESARLKTYERFLPSLDLKRKQLVAERAKAEHELLAGKEDLEAIWRRVAEALPMLAMPLPGLDGMAKVTAVRLGTENIVGTELPTLEEVEISLYAYPLLGKPHWIDALGELLRIAMEMTVQQQVRKQRLTLLDAAVRTITQRVNLFDKVLIPRSREHIKAIRIFLADGERAAVVRAKIAKKKRAVEFQ